MALVNTLTLVILAIIGLFTLISCSWNLFVLNKVQPHPNLSEGEISMVKGVNIFGIVLSIITIAVLVYNIFAPKGTMKKFLTRKKFLAKVDE